MVRGAVLIVTPVSGTNQCAEIARIAFGLATLAPMRCQPSVYGLVSSAFRGLPWPKKIAGSISPMSNPIIPNLRVRFRRRGTFIRQETKHNGMSERARGAGIPGGIGVKPASADGGGSFGIMRAV